MARQSSRLKTPAGRELYWPTRNALVLFLTRIVDAHPYMLFFVQKNSHPWIVPEYQGRERCDRVSDFGLATWKSVCWPADGQQSHATAGSVALPKGCASCTSEFAQDSNISTAGWLIHIQTLVLRIFYAPCSCDIR